MKWARYLFAIILLFSFANPLSEAATSLAGKSCTKAGSTTISSGWKFTCVKSGKKLVWNKGVKVPAPQAQPQQPGQPLQPLQPGQPLQPLQPGQPTGQPQPNNTPSPQPNNTPSPQPSSTSTSTTASTNNQNNNKIVGPKVTEYSSSYSTLAASTGTRVTSFSDYDAYFGRISPIVTSNSLTFDHPGALSSGGSNLALADSWNNRILLWSTAPNSASTAPDIILCQANSTATASGSALNQCNWPRGVTVTSDGKILVADTNNNRILVWLTFPTSSGQAANFAIELGADAWNWGIWSNGTKVLSTSTRKSQLKIWNTFPTSASSAPDITLEGNSSNCLGTPRGVTSNGSIIVVGDHNSKCTELDHGGFAKEVVGHVFTSWPTSSTAAVAFNFIPYGAAKEGENLASGECHAGPAGGWPEGVYNPTNGKWYFQSRYLFEYSTMETKPTGGKDVIGAVVGSGLDTYSGKALATCTPFVGGDGGAVAFAGGNTYVMEYNGNRVAVFNGIPTVKAEANFYLGSTGLDKSIVATNPEDKVENSQKTVLEISNPHLVTLAGQLAVVTELNRTISIWKTIPSTQDAKPDIVWETSSQNTTNPLLDFEFAPQSVTAAVSADGTAIFAVAGYLTEKQLVIWKGLPTKASDVPFINAKNTLGGISLGGGGDDSITMDSKYFYLLDSENSKVYVWEGYPSSSSDLPDFSFSVATGINKIRSDGTWFLGLCQLDCGASQFVAIKVSELKSSPTVYKPRFASMACNGPSDVSVYLDTLYIVCATDNRVEVYYNFSTKVITSSLGAADAYLGATSATDKDPGKTKKDLNYPKYLWIAEGHLWVSEFKFGNDIYRWDLT